MTTGIDGRKLATEGLHTVELRNRAERHSLATGYKLRFQQLVVADKTYTAQTIRYSYDKLARVREARYAAGVNGLAADADLLRRYQYAFDVAGNRTQQSVALNSAAPTVTNYTYNAGNQLTSDGTNSYTYDSNGNLTSYTWDRANRMIGGGGATFSYDGAGNRLSQTVSSVVTQYLNDVQPGLAVVLRATQGANTERYAYSPRGIHEQEMGGQWYWSLQDGLGSVRGMSNNATAIVNVGNYDPYGVPFGGISGVSQMHGFTGEATNALGDVYLRARHYSPARGVFVSEDFLEMPNRYSYALGDVINQVDPNGLQPIKTYDRGGGGGAGTIIISRPTVTIDLAGGRNFGAPPTGQSWITVNAGSLGPSRGALHVSDGSQVALNPLTIPPGQTIINAFSPANFGGGVGFNEYLPEPVSNPSPNMPPDPAAAFCPAPQSENIREQEEQLSGNDIALGITQQGGFPLLREFTERLNSEPYRSRFGIVNDVVWWSDWADTFVTTVDFYDGMSPSEFRQGFSQVVSQAARIHVNLERVEERFELDDLYDFTDEEILAVYQRTYAFAYELYQIKSNVDICERTTFYLNGSTNPTIADEFKDEFCF
jgi:RHS repeat-associated protein